MRQALAKTIDEKGVETMRQDSIRAYKSMSHAEGETMTIAVGDETLRRHLREPRLRERAYITYTVGKDLKNIYRAKQGIKLIKKSKYE